MTLKRICYFIALIIIFSFGFAYADPSPLGLTLGKATVNDLKAKYSVKMKGINSYSNGEMYEISTSNLDTEGLKEATAIFDSKGVLVAVTMDFSQTKFGENYYYWDKVYTSLKSKYKLVKAQVPFVGDRYAEFVSGDSIIILNAPHMSFDMTLIYAKKSFWQAVKEAEKKEKTKKQKSLERNL